MTWRSALPGVAGVVGLVVGLWLGQAPSVPPDPLAPSRDMKAGDVVVERLDRPNNAVIIDGKVYMIQPTPPAGPASTVWRSTTSKRDAGGVDRTWRRNLLREGLVPLTRPEPVDDTLTTIGPEAPTQPAAGLLR